MPTLKSTTTPSTNIILVPDLSAVDLTAQLKRGMKVGDKELPLTYLDSTTRSGTSTAASTASRSAAVARSSR